jgi:3-oxoacyl-[acyl-carrier protein] reductase
LIAWRSRSPVLCVGAGQSGRHGTSDREEGRTGLAIKADSADPTAVRDAVTQTVAQRGRLDIVVVNAGIYRKCELQAVSLEELDLMLNINVRGVFLAIETTAAYLSEGGRIITIGSNTAVRSGYPGSASTR